MSKLVHKPVFEACKKYEHRVAIDQEGEKTFYGELGTLSNKFASLISKIAKGEKYVGILSPVHTKSIISVLGLLKAGLAYVPLDFKSPTERLKKVIKDAKLKVIIIDPSQFKEHSKLFDKKMKLINLSNKKINFEHITNWKEVNQAKEIDYDSAKDTDLSYILYTSGSTGIPKGVMLSHKNARAFTDWMQKEFKLKEEDIVISRSPFQFDFSVFDIFNTLSVGATLIVQTYKKNRKNKHKAFVDLMKKKKVSVIYATPSTYITFMNKGGLNKSLKSLRLMLYAGEPFHVPLVIKLMKTMPNSKIANIYGPTETNIVTYYWIEKILKEDSIPLGKPIDNTTILILDENKKKCKVKEIGEIFVSGPTVMKGYLGRPELNKKVFLRLNNKLFYKTGDYGRIRKDGNIMYHGRKDNMIKTRGFRVELGEVESAISSYEYVDEFAVISFKHKSYQNTLCMFLTVKNGFEIEKFKEHLKKKLPYYMIPYEYVKLKTMPKTSSRKIDREGLKNMNVKRKKVGD
ncbi:amino acid adenylation domain-containing protein [Candidatus Woesearchaeota archaeon]|nr:amino acid adenylation domain-containing protein [Candidatus Woesearchaeota archaeon]